MTTLTAHSLAADAFLRSENLVYLTARTGSSVTLFSSSPIVGQTISGADSRVYEAFLSFDTSSIPDTATITSATLSLDGISDSSTTDFTIQARLYDWGTAVTTGDWVAGESLSALPLLATFATAGGFGTGYNDFTSEATFKDNISKTGETRIILCSSRTVNGNAPGGAEFVTFNFSDAAGTSEDPKLVVEYTEVGGGANTKRLMGMVA